MAEKLIQVWYDKEGDFLEVMFETKTGYFRETDDYRVMEKVDPEGSVLGFSILGVSRIGTEPLQVALSQP